MMDPSGQTIQFLHGVPVPLEIVQGQIFDTDTGVEITLDNNEEQVTSIKDEAIEEVEEQVGDDFTIEESAEEVGEDYVNENSDNEGDSADENVGQITYTYSNGEIVETMPPSLSHHDYIATVQPQQIISSKQDLTEFQVPMGMANNGGLEITNQGTFQVPVEMQNELVIEEAPETEVIAQSAEDEEMVRSKPLTALYLQRKEINLSDHQALRINPFKSPPSSSTFQGKPSSSLSYDSPGSYNGSQSDDDINRMRISYGNSCFYNLSTGELQLKIDPEEMEGKLKLNPERSVGAILAASEAIKHQDIASEVEIGTYEDVSPPKQKGRKKKTADKGGIDEDIEKIKKAAKNVAFTLKGMKEKSGRKRRKPRIRLTLTKAKGKKSQPVYSDEEEEEEGDRDNEALYESIAETPAKRKRKTTYNSEQPNIIYQCEYCEKQFKTREKVRCHTRIHTEDRNFHCEICGRNYRRREHLVRHYRRHTNDRPYQCVLCGKSYMRAEHLKRHSYFHSGEKPFECAVCDKAFARHDRLIKHSLVHDA